MLIELVLMPMLYYIMLEKLVLMLELYLIMLAEFVLIPNALALTSFLIASML